MSEIKRSGDGFSIDLRWMDKVPARLARNPVYLKMDMPEGTGLDIFGAISQPCLRPAEKPFLKLTVSGQERRIFIRPHRVI